MGCGIVLGKPWSGPLADQVEYRAGSIARRELVKNGAGAVTLFALDAGQVVAEHAAPFDAMIQVVEGRCDVTVAGEVHAVSTHDAVLVPAHSPHALAAPERTKFVLTMLRA